MGLDNLDQNYYDRNFPGSNHPWKPGEKEQSLEPHDALGNPVIIGACYGYSQQNSGSVLIVKGIAEKSKDLKITLGSIKTRSGLWGRISTRFSKEERKRSVNACHLFPISL